MSFCPPFSLLSCSRGKREREREKKIEIIAAGDSIIAQSLIYFSRKRALRLHDVYFIMRVQKTFVIEITCALRKNNYHVYTVLSSLCLFRRYFSITRISP